MPVSRPTSELSQTQPERPQHPIKEFLDRCGADVSEFPFVRFLIETSEKEIRSGRLYIALRIPSEPGYIYDSIIRITRVLEIPAISGEGHRKFLELEWEIDEHPVPEDSLHDAIQFLGTEVMCPKCRELFNPDPDIIDQYSIRVECSQCLFAWNIKATALEKADARVPLLLDLLRADPASMRRYLRQWDQQPIDPTNSLYFSYFPFHFENLEEQSSLDLLFGEQAGLVALSNGVGQDFELLARGLLNQISVEYFRRSEFSTPTQSLDKTEIQRKERETVKIHEDLPEVTPIVRVTPIEDQFEIKDNSIEPVVDTPRVLKFTTPIPSDRFVAHQKAKEPIAARLAFVGIGVVSILFIFYIVSKNMQITPSEPVAQTTPNALTTADESKTSPASLEQLKPVETNRSNEDSKLLDQALAATRTEAKQEVKKEVSKPIKRAPVAREEVAPKPSPKSSPADEKLKAERVETFYRQGMLHLKLQQSKEAESEFQQVIELDPKHAPAYRGLGLAFVYDQRFNEAISAFEKYLKTTQDNFDRDSIEELIQTLRERAANSSPVAKQ